MEYRTYRQNLKIISEGEDERLVCEEVPEGYVLEVTHMCLSGCIALYKWVRLGYVSQTDVDRVFKTSTTEAGPYFLELNGRVWIEGGERPFGAVDGAAENNIIYFSCHGKLWPLA